MLSDAELAEMRAVNRLQRNLTDDARLRERGIELRHPAKPPHEQWMHAGKAKVAAKKAAAALKAAGQDVPEPKTPAEPKPAERPAKRPSRPTRAEIAAAKAHARKLGGSRDVAWANRDRVARGLSRQAEIAPRRLRALHRVHLPGADSADGRAYLDGPISGGAYAYYSESGTHPSTYGTQKVAVGARPEQDPAIWLHPHWDGDQGLGRHAVSHHRSTESGWLTPSGAGSEMEAVLAHEFGHHVTNDFFGEYGFDGTPDLRLDVGLRLLPVINDALGANRIGGQYDTSRPDKDLLAPVSTGFVGELEQKFTGHAMDRWVDLNRDLITEKVSGYAAKNFHEFLAEIWQEYSTKGDDARPHIKVIGDLMRQIAEETSS